jgi:hypothetical protein
MKVRIESAHPISGGYREWAVYDAPFQRLLDVVAIGKWLTRKEGITFDYRPGTSRLIDGVPYFFPKRYTIGVHAMRVVEVKNV